MKPKDTFKLLGVIAIDFAMTSCAQVTINTEAPSGELVSSTIGKTAVQADVPAYIRERRPTNNQSFKFFVPLLSWKVKEISLNWDCDKVVQTHIEKIIGSDWEHEEITLKATGYSKRTIQNTGNLIEQAQTIVMSAAVVATGEPSNAGAAVAKVVSVAASKSPGSESATWEKSESTFKGKTESEQTTIRNYKNEVTSLLTSETLKNLRLTVVIDFFNLTGETITFENPAVPVYSGEALLGDATQDASVTIPPRNDWIPQSFNYALDNGRGIELLEGEDWTAKILGAKGTFKTSSGVDLLKEFSEDRKLYIVGPTTVMSIHFRDNGRKNSVRDFIENLNEQIGSVHGEKGVEINGNWKYLKSVFGSESGGNNLWQICVLRNGKRVPLSADEDLPEKENIFLCCASVDDVKRSWFEDGADANDPCALYWMGVCWERGIDGEVDFKKAVEYFSALAKTDFAFPEVFKIRMGERYNYRQIDDRKFSKEVLGAWKQCWEKEVDELKEILFERWVGTRDDYMKIKQKCDYISRYYGRSIQETRLLKFAREYSNWLDSYERKYQLHAKRCRRVKYGHNYIDRIGCQDESIRFDSDYKPGKNFEFTQKEPWEEIEVSYRKRKRGTDDNQGTDCEFLKGLGDLKLSDPHRVFKKTQLEITIKPLNGKTVHELWNEIF